MKLLTGLLLIASGLAAVVAVEVADAPRGDVAPLAGHTVTAVSPSPPPRTDHTDAWVSTVLARPLFSPDRRPPADAAAAAGSRLPGLPRLAGIIVGPFGRSAIFAPDGNKPLVVQEGARIAAYTVKSIEATQVRLVGPDGARVLYPSFESNAAPARGVAQAALPK